MSFSFGTSSGFGAAAPAPAPTFGGFGSSFSLGAPASTPAPAPAPAPAPSFGGFGSFGAPAPSTTSTSLFGTSSIPAPAAAPVPVYDPSKKIDKNTTIRSVGTISMGLKAALTSVDVEIKRKKLICDEIEASLAPKFTMFQTLNAKLSEGDVKLAQLRKLQTESLGPELKGLQSDMEKLGKHVDITNQRASVISSDKVGTASLELPSPVVFDFYSDALERRKQLILLLEDTSCIVNFLGSQPLDGQSRKAELQHLSNIIDQLSILLVTFAGQKLEPMNTLCNQLCRDLQTILSKIGKGSINIFARSDANEERKSTEHERKIREKVKNSLFEKSKSTATSSTTSSATTASIAAPAPAPAPTSSFGGFGAPAPAPAPSSSFGGFGSFGAPPPAPAPAPASSFGGFGAPAPAPSPAPAFGGFGAPAPAPAPAPASSFGGFGSFGAPSPAPAPTPAPAFGGFGSFGSSAPAPAPAFGGFGGFGSGLSISVPSGGLDPNSANTPNRSRNKKR